MHTMWINFVNQVNLLEELAFHYTFFKQLLRNLKSMVSVAYGACIYLTFRFSVKLQGPIFFVQIQALRDYHAWRFTFSEIDEQCNSSTKH